MPEDEDVLRPLMAVEHDLPDGPDPGTVMVGYLSGSNVSNLFLHSMLSLSRFDAEEGFGRLQHRNWWFNQRSGVNVSKARNDLVRRFLAMRDPAPEWLLMTDADMSFGPGALESLLAATVVPADDVTENGDSLRRVVGGLCLAFGIDPESQFTTTPPKNAVMSTAFDPGPPLPGVGILPFRVLKKSEVPKNTLREVYGTGAAFLLVHRQVLIDIAYMTNSRYGWFREIIVPDERPDVDMLDANDYWVSEDLFFCLQSRAAGHRVFVHTGVEVQHVKSIRLTEKLWRQYARVPESA